MGQPGGRQGEGDVRLNLCAVSSRDRAMPVRTTGPHRHHRRYYSHLRHLGRRTAALDRHHQRCPRVGRNIHQSRKPNRPGIARHCKDRQCTQPPAGRRPALRGSQCCDMDCLRTRRYPHRKSSYRDSPPCNPWLHRDHQCIAGLGRTRFPRSLLRSRRLGKTLSRYTLHQSMGPLRKRPRDTIHPRRKAAGMYKSQAHRPRR